jgi:putative SOS response-associated peptidase YedK
MCGRFALATPEELAEHFGLEKTLDFEPRYNIAPSQDIAVVRHGPGTRDRELVLLRWGLVPFWAKDKKIGYKMINARAESVADKPAFRAAFKRRRCLIPASGFFEWDHKAKSKQPYFVRLQDSNLLAFAGLWEHWQGGDGETIESCTIVTTDANKSVGRIHDRMPAIIEPAEYAQWLEPMADRQELASLIRPFPDRKMLVYPVGKGVNNPKNDNPECLLEIRDNA